MMHYGRSHSLQENLPAKPAVFVVPNIRAGAGMNLHPASPLRDPRAGVKRPSVPAGVQGRRVLWGLRTPSSVRYTVNLSPLAQGPLRTVQGGMMLWDLRAPSGIG